ncbi:MAG: 50S ribosomal protein L9 [Proteobacteria bacterium]|nr:50S ribosomal protein L9 [Desulfobacteraceae bacterium]MBU4055773.1 50S ribosomal protein L9 [Pseudomonadota bacterium]MBU4317380.1 50S ribosomal protein L9 [Pseudomonadota bacterium]MBU4469981.1 50S ribosomal protein L9 [Pseudomonadota bacterium]MCG2753743.1 50S ribosomal protein L9 [Desulfobacteraceae bacterium]
MKVILKETIESLGIIGSAVKVKDGYARNYLLPQKKAVIDTVQNRKVLEQEKTKFDLQIAKEVQIATEMAEKLKQVVCIIRAKVSDEERLYGSITVRDIIKALADQSIVVQKRMVLLKDAIKNLGTFEIPIRIYKDIEPKIKVEIVPEA